MKPGTLYLDPREGSGKLAGPLDALGLPVVTKRMEAGDVAFLSHAGEPIGIEIKTLGDFYASMRTGRLQGRQLPLLAKTYKRSYLIIEGIWRPMPNGLVATRRGRLWVTSWFRRNHGLRFDEMHGFLLTLEERAGVSWRRSTGALETLHLIKSIYRWWSDKPVEKHRSHLAFHREPDPHLLSKPSLTRLWAKELPGVGWDRAKQIEKFFPSAQALALADISTWKEVPGIGKTLATRIVSEIEQTRKG